MTIEISRGSVITVDRRAGKLRAGQGLMQGLGVVWHHWVSSFRKLENFTQTAGTFTVEYPDERIKLPETYRNMPILLYDEESGHELCTSCFQCERICPPQVIHMTQAKDPATGKAVPAVAEFVIEYDACMSCGFCAEVCPFDAIKMDHEFELSTGDHTTLTVHKEALNRPISYYVKIAPTLWDEVKEGALKKLQGNMKRRSGLIGIAPQLAEKVRALRGITEEAPPPVAKPAAPKAAPKPAAPAPQAPAEPAAKAATPEEKAAKLAAIRAANAARQGEAAPPAAEPAAAASADDKAAKLAAIRAANAAKKGGQEPPAPPAAVAPAAAPADDKAAKLAAIRAANAAKKAGQEPPAEPAAAAPPAAVPPAAGPAISDEKAARLAAIRAANAARQSGSTATPPPAELPTVEKGANGQDEGSNGHTETAPPNPPAPGAPVSDEKAARLAAIRAANAAKKQADKEQA